MTKNNRRVFNDRLRSNSDLWVGISTTLKRYPESFAEEIVDIACKSSSPLIVIADDIAAITYRALGNSERRAARITQESGDHYFNLYSRIAGNRATVVRWADVNDKRTEQAYLILKDEYHRNADFQAEIQKPIREYMRNRPHNLTGKRIEALSEYVLRELYFLLDGTIYDDVRYDTLLYPTYRGTSLSGLSESIQQGTRFPHIKKELGLKGDHTLIEYILPADC